MKKHNFNFNKWYFSLSSKDRKKLWKIAEKLALYSALKTIDNLVDINDVPLIFKNKRE